MVNLLNEGLKVQQAIVDANTRASNIIEFPTDQQVAAIRAQGKRLVHKPKELERFIPENDTPLDAA